MRLSVLLIFLRGGVKLRAIIIGSFYFLVMYRPRERKKLRWTTVMDEEGIVSVMVVFLMNRNQNGTRIDACEGRISKEKIENGE